MRALWLSVLAAGSPFVPAPALRPVPAADSTKGSPPAAHSRHSTRRGLSFHLHSSKLSCTRAFSGSLGSRDRVRLSWPLTAGSLAGQGGGVTLSSQRPSCPRLPSASLKVTKNVFCRPATENYYFLLILCSCSRIGWKENLISAAEAGEGCESDDVLPKATGDASLEAYLSVVPPGFRALRASGNRVLCLLCASPYKEHFVTNGDLFPSKQQAE